MGLPPQKFREIVVQLLYSRDFGPIDAQECTPFMMRELKVTRRTMAEVHHRIDQILAKCPEIDPMIEEASLSYAFQRISNVEKAILRWGAFELLFDASLAGSIIITEAIRLTRKFASPEGARFVHAILSAIQVYVQRKQSAEHTNASVAL